MRVCFCVCLVWALVCGAVRVGAASIDYTPYETQVDRLPPLQMGASAVAGDGGYRLGESMMLPDSNVPSTYGVFASDTQLASRCYIFVRDTGSGSTTEALQPLLPSQLPQVRVPGNTWYGWFCVTDASILALPSRQAGAAFSFLRDIKPWLDSGTSTWRQRQAWGAFGFSYTLCRNIDAQWITFALPPNPPGITYSTNNDYYACRERYLGYFHNGLPQAPNVPTPAAYDAVNTGIPYFCVNHTVWFDKGNDNAQGGDGVNYQDPTSSDSMNSTQSYLKYTIQCFAKDGFADAYIDTPAQAPPQTLVCSDGSDGNSIMKMVEACEIDIIESDTLTLTDQAAVDYSCELQCRFPCITQTAYMTFQSQSSSSVCTPRARATQCNADVRTLGGLFCEASETLSAYQVTLSNTLDAFSNNVIQECPVGALGCRVECHCRGANGCPNHSRCNQHGTLWDTSIVSSPPLTPICMCEPGRKGDNCTETVSNVICNQGAEL
jgi:hypothetical protein